MPDLDQITVNVYDIIPPDNFATVDAGAKVGTVYTKEQDNEWRAEVEESVQQGMTSGIKGVATTTNSPTSWATGDPDLYERWRVLEPATLTNFKDVSNTAIVVTSSDFAYNQNGKPTNDVLIDFINGVSKKQIIKIGDGGFGGLLGIADVPSKAPTYYFAKESGTYVNAGGLIVDITGKLVILGYDGMIWAKEEISMPQAGILDLDRNFPLSSGFYTPDTARLAVPIALRRAGLIIYYATSANNYTIEKFNFSAVSQWTVSTHWIRYADINDLKKHNVSSFLLPDSVLTNYNADSIINLGKVNYVENSDQLYISVLKKTPPVFQVSNGSGVLIGSYAVSTGTATGVKEIEIKNVGSNPGTTTLFKALVNWDLLKENDNLQQQLHINTTVNYLNDLPKQVDSKLQNVIVKDNFYLKSENFFDKNDPNILQEKWIPSNSTTGNPEPITLVSILTGFLGPFKTGDKVNATVFGNPDKHPPAWIAVFDENKNIITKSSILLLGYDGYTMLEGEKYIRFAPRKTDVPLTDVPNLMVTVNQRITSPYIPYGASKYLNPQNTIVTGAVRVNQTGVVFADSIGELSNWPNIAGKLLGCNLINCAIGGTRMALHQITPNDYDAFSAYNLAEAVVSGNWTRQDAAAIAIRDNTGDDNVYIVNRMKAINWALVDFIVLGFGTNDLTGGTCPIGTNSDNTGTTIKGAMNLFLSKIQTAFPKIEILVITPIYRNIEGVSSDTYANGRTPPVTMRNIIDAEEEIAKINHIDVLTMYDTLGMNAKTLTTYTVDGTHLSDFGAQKYALKVANKLG